MDQNKGSATEGEVSYYTPSAYPPVTGTTYTRHEPAVAKATDFPAGKEGLRGIAVDPGPGAGKDRLFLTSFDVTHVYKSAQEGSGLLDGEFAKDLKGLRQSIAVDGGRGRIYFGENNNAPLITVVGGAHGEEILARIDETGSPTGPGGANPLIAVDQANGHAVEFDGARSTAREYDASGSFVAEFGSFTAGLPKLYRVAIDSACAIHEPPLTGEACKAFDPADGTAYVAYDDTKSTHPPYDLTAFGPLTYATPAKHKLTVKKTGTGSGKVESTSPASPKIICGTECEKEFDETEVVTLTAEAGAGSEFIGWSGCEAEPSPSECEVTSSKDREVVATFEGSGHVPLEVTPKGTGSGEVTSEPSGIECPATCKADFGENVEVVLTAKADPGSEFEGWEGCDAEPSETECEVTMTEPKEVKAKFGPEHPLLTVKVKGPGAVSSSPPGIACPPTCSAKFDLEEEVTLTAEPEEAAEFEGWEGCDAEPSETECEVTMDEPRQVKATFLALPQAIAKPAHPITYTEATLRGEVDTAGLATEYRFEYLSEEEYEDNGGGFEGALHTPMRELAPAEDPVAVEAHLLGLGEGTQYRFRLRAMNSVGSGEDEGSFETLQRQTSLSCANAAYRTGPSANLPDCRAYELVTPADVGGALLVSAHVRLNLGDGFNNWLTVPRGAGAGEAFSFLTSATLPGFEGSGGESDRYLSERGVGAHPEAGWSTELTSPTYAQGDIGVFGLGGSTDQLYSLMEVRPQYSFETSLPKGNYLGAPGGFEFLGRGSLGADPVATGQYVSAGGAHVLFSSKAHLEAAAAPSATEAIYDRAAGKASAEVVSVKPGGGSFGGGEGATFLGANEEGTAVAFMAGGTLYLRHEGQTKEVAGGAPTYAGVSEDGERVFYAGGGAKLRTFEAGVQTKITEGGEATFVDVSADGSHAFFTSSAALTPAGEENENGEHAEAGEHNLYAWDGVGNSFLAQLDPQDLIGFEGGQAPHTHLGAWDEAILADSASGIAHSPARSTPGGGVFVFQSHARLAAYDNEGVGEIYRYAPAAPAGERLRCVSCDPSGAAPGGGAVLENTTPRSGIDRNTTIPNVTDGGEAVFFQSPDRLLPEDSNEVEDVYEWRAKGTGTPECARPGGCLALISSGQGSVPSFLYAMSAEGRDVFFRTPEKLLGSDVAGSPSIYDAREGGGIPEAVEVAPCQGDACQPQGPEAPALPAPATTGPGEEAPPQAWPCARGRHRVGGRCVKRHTAKHRRHRHRRTHR